MFGIVVGAAPTVEISGPETIIIGPGNSQVCLDAAVSSPVPGDVVSVLWEKAPFTAVGIAYDSAAFPYFADNFGRAFLPQNELFPSGPGPVVFTAPTSSSTCAIFNTATHFGVVASHRPVVEPGRRSINYTLGNANRDGAYLLTVTATDSSGNTATDSVIVKVLTNENPRAVGTADSRVPPRDEDGRDGADPRSEHEFLEAMGTDNAGVAEAYYKTIDPGDERLTQEAWREVNGFNDPLNTVVVAKGYFNHGDLGFGRVIDMVVDQRPGKVGNIAFTTENQLSAEAARLGVDVVSTVNMEYSPVVPGGPRITKFYIYAGLGGVNRKGSTNFEGRGDKYLPAVCFACHAGRDSAGTLLPGVPYPNGGNTRSYFLPIDTRVMEFTTKTSLASLEAPFKLMNQAVLQTNPTSATKALIRGLYGGSTLPRATQDRNFVPADWQAAGEAALYRDVIVPSCVNCHSTVETEVLSFSWFKESANEIRESVFEEPNMPNSLPGYNRFWLSTNPYQPKILSDALTRFGSPPRVP